MTAPTRTLSGLLLLASITARAAAQAPAGATAQIDQIFARWDSGESPGCAVGVAQNGRTVLTRAYGMADLEFDVPNTPETIFEGGSLSKQFTAAAVVLLALDGKLSLDDDVRTYVPEVPDYGTTIRLRHLLNHTSGLRDWGSVAGISGWGRQERTHTHAHVLDIVSRQSALNYEPGREYSYTNTGYNLLAIIVDRVSGMSFAEFSRRRIFEPLGLTHTQWRDDYTRIVKGRSTAYDVRNGRVSIMRPIENVHGNGGILTTVGDLLKWNEALTEERLGGAEFTRLMLDRGVLNDGRRIEYASGLRVSTFAGVPSITHTGSTSGYRAFLGRYPDQHLSVAMLCNASNVQTGQTGGRIARVFLGDAAHDVAEPAGGEVTTAALEDKASLYRDVQTGDPMELTMDGGGGGLRRDGRVRLVALSPNTFQAGNARYEFHPGPGGVARVVVRNGDEIDTFEPVAPFDPSPSDLRAYEGEYYSHDAETTFRLAVENGRLVAHRRPDWQVELSPVYRDAFDATRLGLVRFSRNEDGRVVGFGLRIGRVYDMRFVKTASLD